MHNFPEATCQLGEGDLYLFFTDGISEANNSSGEEFGEERLEKLIVRFAESGPKTILDEMRNSVMRFSGKTRRRDDITAIAVKIKDTFNKSG